MSAKQTRAANAGAKSLTAVEAKMDILSCDIRTRPRSVRKNYCESDNSEDFSSEGDEDEQNQKKKSRRLFSKARKSEETDSFSSDDEDFEPQTKKVKSKKLGRTVGCAGKTKTKLGIPVKNSNSAKWGKNKDDDEDSSEEEERQEMNYKSRGLLLSSEGSDSDILEPKTASPKHDDLEKCKQDVASRYESEQKQTEVGKEKDVKGSGENIKTVEWMQNVKNSVFHDVKDLSVNRRSAETKTMLKDADSKNLPCLMTSEKVGKPGKGKSSSKRTKKEILDASKSKDDDNDSDEGDSDDGKRPKKGKQTNRRKKTVKKKGKEKAGDAKKMVASQPSEEDIRAMLMKVEGNWQNTEDSGHTAEESGDSTWEEVADDPTCASTSTKQPQESIEITLELEQWMKKKKRKKSYQEEWQAFMQRIFNNFQRNLRIHTHKVHLLCSICHGLYLNKICNDPTVQALGLSLVTPTPSQHKLTLMNIKDLVIGFSKTIEMRPKENPDGGNCDEDFSCNAVMEAFSLHRASCVKELVLMIAATLRALGLRIRIVLSFHPIPMKDAKKSKTKIQTPKRTSLTPNAPTKPTKSSNEPGAGVKQAENKKGKKSKTPKTTKAKETPKPEPSKETTDRSKYRPSRTRKPNINYKDAESDDSLEDEMKPEAKKSTSKKLTVKSESDSSGSLSSDFEEDTIKFRNVENNNNNNKKKKNATTIVKKTPHKILSSSSSENSLSTKHASDLETWIEIYLEEENRWLSVDCVDLIFDNVGHFGKLSSRPLVYVVAFDNDGYLKDLTARYSNDFLVKTRKLRVDKEWWDETLKPYVNTSADDIKEDEQIKDSLLDRPLPKTIGEYKSHPFYALKRHLLKFEAIYPNSAVPLGFIRNEPIYARECVVQLHARETWMKEGRCVKIGEEPYKMVKSRPKWNKPKTNPDIPDLEVFGFWQTEVYVPPPAVDGKIPRNEYGNVELYKPSMLPGGTVHLTEPGLNRIARKLGLDCAAAMVGWDFHGGSSHPVFDGWIVCVEHKEKILEEWDKEQQLAKERETAKREKRIYGNWKKLIRGLRIREALKRKYDLQESEDAEDVDTAEMEEKVSQSTTKSTSATVGDKGDDDDDDGSDDDDDDSQPKNQQKSLKRKCPGSKTKAATTAEEPSPSTKKKKTTKTKTTTTKKETKNNIKKCFS